MAELSRSAASLRLFGDDLNPDEITKQLGYPADYGFLKGTVQTLPNGRERVHKYGSWRIKAEDREPGDLNAQILEILVKLSSDLSVWHELTTKFRADIFCGLFLNDGNEGVTISPLVAKMLGERGLELDLDIYSGDSDE